MALLLPLLLLLLSDSSSSASTASALSAALLSFLPDPLPDLSITAKGSASTAAARADYQLFLCQIGMTEEDAYALTSDERDMISMPAGFDVEIRESQIAGMGLFALREFAARELICPGRVNSYRTPAGRYTNHSPSPNAEPIMLDSGDIIFVALHPILHQEEILVDYRDSIRVNLGIEIK